MKRVSKAFLLTALMGVGVTSSLYGDKVNDLANALKNYLNKEIKSKKNATDAQKKEAELAEGRRRHLKSWVDTTTTDTAFAVLEDALFTAQQGGMVGRYSRYIDSSLPSLGFAEMMSDLSPEQKKAAGLLGSALALVGAGAGAYKYFSQPAEEAQPVEQSGRSWLPFGGWFGGKAPEAPAPPPVPQVSAEQLQAQRQQQEVAQAEDQLLLRVRHNLDQMIPALKVGFLRMADNKLQHAIQLMTDAGYQPINSKYGPLRNRLKILRKNMYENNFDHVAAANVLVPLLIEEVQTAIKKIGL